MQNYYRIFVLLGDLDETEESPQDSEENNEEVDSQETADSATAIVKTDNDDDSMAEHEDKSDEISEQKKPNSDKPSKENLVSFHAYCRK